MNKISGGDKFEEEPISMFELLKKMQESKEAEEENQHPNIQENDSGNDSFGSDDILETLETKDAQQQKSELDERVKELEELDDQEFSIQIETALLHGLQKDNESKGAVKYPSLDKILMQKVKPIFYRI